mgnify:CR=1 FL=1
METAEAKAKEKEEKEKQVGSMEQLKSKQADSQPEVLLQQSGQHEPAGWLVIDMKRVLWGPSRCVGVSCGG